MNNHKSAIRNSRVDSNADCVKLYRHYTDPEHSLADLRVTILQECTKAGDLSKAEREWIWKLGTLFPKGLNVNDGYSCQLQKPRKRGVL